jgi:response regulator of citrate/malate metabolism
LPKFVRFKHFNLHGLLPHHHLTLRMAHRVANLWIIDNDPMVSFYIKRLTELGALADIITIYDSPGGAIEYLLLHKTSMEHLPDIILLDIYMPEMDGWEFIKEFQKIKDQLSKPVEIHIITSSNHPKDIDRAKSFPEVITYLQKPVTLEALQEVVSKHNSLTS